jgi:murein L,D-transpeptidase YafK
MPKRIRADSTARCIFRTPTKLIGIGLNGMQNGFGWLGALHRRIDWTDGCIAMTNDEIDEIWKMVDVGTPVAIRP